MFEISYKQSKMNVIQDYVYSGNCTNRTHHSFKDFMKREEDLGRTAPMLDAFMLRNFKDVRHILEVWRVDIETTSTLFISPVLADI